MTDKPNVPERIELPNGWYFKPLGFKDYYILTEPTGEEQQGFSWKRADARAFAATMAPAGCGADLREAYKIADNIRCLQTAGRTGREVADQICGELKALAATPAPSVQASASPVYEFCKDCGREWDGDDAPSCPHCGGLHIEEREEAQPKASEPSAGAADNILEYIANRTPAERLEQSFTDTWQSELLATALREAELRGARKMQEAVVDLVGNDYSKRSNSKYLAERIRALSPETIVEGK